MSAPSIVAELVERFDAHRATYQSGQYNEAQLRQEFINPLFEALGWDVYNRKGYADAYKEVIHEDAIRIGGRTKAPDYCFRAGGGSRSFFVEAKKPSVDISEAIGPAFQLRRYAWSAKLSLSVLTDFEEFAVYDCRIKPVKTDKAAVARVLWLKYTDYADRWDELVGLFSPDAIRRGAIERYAASKKIKKGTAEVDAAFLAEIEGWRIELAQNLALRNPGISQRDLNVAVQRIIDRIVFLRIAEDRGVEPYGTLQSLPSAPDIYARLGELFRRADDRYNSGLFHFTAEKDRPEPPDELTPALQVDDKTLKGILDSIYFPESPYEFSVFPAEVLGQVYEQFLGKVIRLTEGHRAKVEEKPEVRKAGGVYYTPAYIVDYIVAHTVGRLLDGKTPAHVAKLRILDPACGSGSFLLGVYEYLLRWHRDWYVADDAEKHARSRSPKLYRGPAGDWRLTTAEKKRILLNNVYGVDIDPQAVEVTKLSLLLKVLEGESGETLANQFRIFHERALPDLEGNIKCGNSLVGSDFLNGHQLDLFDDEQRWRINVFDWRDPGQGFGAIMASGGFDAVIGNPPYVRIQTLNETQPEAVEYFGSHYAAAAKGNYDIYVLFIEKALSLLNESGFAGLILPSKFLATDYGASVRRLLSDRQAVDQIVDFRHGQVFPKVTTYTCLLFLSGSPRPSLSYAVVERPDSLAEEAPIGLTIDEKRLSDAPWTALTDGDDAILRKLQENARRLLEIPAEVSRGCSTGADGVFMLRVTRKGLVTRDGEAVKVEKRILRAPLFATDFGRYRFRPHADEKVIFPYRQTKTGYRPLTLSELRSEFPDTLEYLSSRKRELRRRKQFRDWFAFSAPRNLALHDNAHLMIPLLADVGSCCALPSGMAAYCPMASGGFTISIAGSCPFLPYYVLGLLNSKLLFWVLQKKSNIFRGGWITCTKQYVGELPIRMIDISDAKDKARHDRMVRLVEAMLALNEKLAAARTSHGKTLIERQIAATDRQIDRLVYDLYGLTDEEIKMIEEATP